MRLSKLTNEIEMHIIRYRTWHIGHSHVIFAYVCVSVYSGQILEVEEYYHVTYGRTKNGSSNRTITQLNSTVLLSFR